MTDYLQRNQAYELLIDTRNRRQKTIDAVNESKQIEATRNCGVTHFYMNDYRSAMRPFDETGEHGEFLPIAKGMTGPVYQRTRQ